jgi:hypothetical protein
MWRTGHALLPGPAHAYDWTPQVVRLVLATPAHLWQVLSLAVPAGPRSTALLAGLDTTGTLPAPWRSIKAIDNATVLRILAALRRACRVRFVPNSSGRGSMRCIGPAGVLRPAGLQHPRHQDGSHDRRPAARCARRLARRLCVSSRSILPSHLWRAQTCLPSKSSISPRFRSHSARPSSSTWRGSGPSFGGRQAANWTCSGAYYLCPRALSTHHTEDLDQVRPGCARRRADLARFCGPSPRVSCGRSKGGRGVRLLHRAYVLPLALSTLTRRRSQLTRKNDRSGRIKCTPLASRARAHFPLSRAITHPDFERSSLAPATPSWMPLPAPCDLSSTSWL